LGKSFADNWLTAWHCPLATSLLTILPLPTSTLPNDDGRPAHKTMTTASGSYVMQRHLKTAI